MAELADVVAQLTGPDGPFAMAEAEVLGERLQVFVNRQPHLRAVLENSANYADLEYIVFAGSARGGRADLRLTFGEHLRVVASVAQALRDRHGVGAGDRVAILAANCPEWIVTFWATVSLGAVAVGMNGWWTADEIAYGLDDAAPRVLLADSKRLDRVRGDLDADGKIRGVPVVETGEGFRELWDHDLDAALPDVAIDEDDPAAILYTSGTTGRPKGAVNSHRNVIALMGLQIFHGMRQVMTAPPPAPDAPPPRPTCQLVANPLFHVSGLYTHVVTFLATAVKTVWTEGRFDPEQVLTLVEREGVTGLSPMGSMAYRLVTYPGIDRFDTASVRNFGQGGNPVGADLQERIRAAFPSARSNFSIGYGLTEGTALACLNWGEDLVSFPDSVGPPLPTIELEIRDPADPTGPALPDGTEGEIFLRSPLVMLGYWRRPEDTAEVILEGRWLRTGDWGRVEDGRLYIASRRRDLILRGGENVYPAEIELRLEAHPAVAEAAVVGVEHEELGQEVKAIVVPADPHDHPEAADLQTWVADALAYYKVPAHWEIRTEALPRNASGKVMKNVLLGDANPFADDGEG